MNISLNSCEQSKTSLHLTTPIKVSGYTIAIHLNFEQSIWIHGAGQEWFVEWDHSVGGHGRHDESRCFWWWKCNCANYWAKISWSLFFIKKTVNFTIIHTFANNSQQIHAHQKTEKCKVENEKVVGSFDEFSVLIGSGISFRVKKTFPSLIESFLQDFHHFQKTHDPVNEEQDWRSFHIYPKLEFCIRLNLNHCCRKR